MVGDLGVKDSQELWKQVKERRDTLSKGSSLAPAGSIFFSCHQQANCSTQSPRYARLNFVDLFQSDGRRPRIPSFSRFPIWLLDYCST